MLFKIKATLPPWQHTHTHTHTYAHLNTHSFPNSRPKPTPTRRPTTLYLRHHGCGRPEAQDLLDHLPREGQVRQHLPAEGARQVGPHGQLLLWGWERVGGWKGGVGVREGERESQHVYVCVHDCVFV
jgi:hypothetical protein